MEVTFRTELENEREKHMSDLEEIGKVLDGIGIDRRLAAIEHGLNGLLSIVVNYAANPSALIREGVKLLDEVNTLRIPVGAIPPNADVAPTDAVVSTATAETTTASETAPVAPEVPAEPVAAPVVPPTAPDAAAPVPPAPPTPTGEPTLAWSPSNGDNN